MKITVEFVMGIAVIALFLGSALIKVGEIPKNCIEPYDYIDVALMMGTLVTLFVCGFKAGRNSK